MGGGKQGRREPNVGPGQLKYWALVYFSSTLQATCPGFLFNYPVA